MVKPNIVIRYGFALFVTSAAWLLTARATRVSHIPLFDVFQGAVVLSAWYGGFGPAMVTSLGSVLILDYFFIPPLHSLELGWADIFRLTVFGTVALLTSTLSARLRRAQQDLQRSHEELEVRVQQRTQELSDEVAQRIQAEKAILEVSGREQRRLGEDLHDGLCQQLAGIKLMSEEVKERLTERAAQEAPELALIESRLSEALAQADSISRGLYPVELETHGLMAALEELVEKLPKVHRVKCKFICWQPVTVDDTTIATHLYRIAQEAMINAIKSGKATKITVRLRTCGPDTILSVADNGIGFHAHPSRNGMGLTIMNYRTRIINASLQFRSRPKGGTVVSCLGDFHASR